MCLIPECGNTRSFVRMRQHSRRDAGIAKPKKKTRGHDFYLECAAPLPSALFVPREERVIIELSVNGLRFNGFVWPLRQGRDG